MSKQHKLSQRIRNSTTTSSCRIPCILVRGDALHRKHPLACTKQNACHMLQSFLSNGDHVLLIPHQGNILAPTNHLWHRAHNLLSASNSGKLVPHRPQLPPISDRSTFHAQVQCDCSSTEASSLRSVHICGTSLEQTFSSGLCGSTRSAHHPGSLLSTASLQGRPFSHRHSPARSNTNPCSTYRIHLQSIARWRGVSARRPYVLQSKLCIQSHHFIPHGIRSCRNLRLRCTSMPTLPFHEPPPTHQSRRLLKIKQGEAKPPRKTGHIRPLDHTAQTSRPALLTRIRSLLHMSEMPTPASDSSQ